MLDLLLLAQANGAAESTTAAGTDAATPVEQSVEGWLSSVSMESATPWVIGLGKVALVVLLVVIAYAIGRRAMGKLIEARGLSIGVSVVINRILFWISVLAVVFFSLQALGILQDAWATLTAILAVVAIGFFAVWSVLSNTLCSVILMFARPFMVGDEIEVLGDGLKGKVIDFSLVYTTLEPDDGGIIRVPNNVFFQKSIRCRRGTQQVALDQQVNEPPREGR